MSAPPPPPKGGGMSLYANLLNPKTDATSSTISSAPVLYDNGEKDDAAKKEVNPALRFQPIRRPQATQKKPSKPTSFPKAMPSQTTTAPSSNDTTAPPPPLTGVSTPPPPVAPQRSTLADWAAAGVDDEFLAAAAEKRRRGGRKAAKKRNKKQAERWQRETDWDEVYDPARPTNVDEYLRSEERVREVQEWKSVLYAHRKRRRGSEEGSEESGEERAGGGNQFAPPASYAFAPPPASPPAATVSVPDDATGDDAYARRLALSGMGAPPPQPPASHTPTAPPPPQDASATISRAPVRYEAPPQLAENMDMDTDDEEPTDLPPALGLGASSAAADDDAQPRKNLPGQKGFAQRLMSKYGWTAGSGLGAESSGIINPLSVQVSKRRKKPDAEGGGFAEPGSRGKIIGGKLPPTAADQQEGKFGAMSEVIVLRNMLEGMEGTLAEEIESGLGQEIGEECGDKYGRVERLYIDVDGRQVFIKFTDAVSALRAVNALEGRVFNGNAIAARFWNAERFERGEYN